MTSLPTTTAAQDRVLNFVREFRRDRGFPPTRAEIARGLGFSSANAADEHLKALDRKGRVILHRGCARGIEVV